MTARLLPQLRRAKDARVVNLSSLAHRTGAINFDDLQSKRSYRPWPAYCQSKLAMLMFSIELQRRSTAAGWGVRSVAAHPGYARTDLIPNGPGTRSLQWRVGKLLQPFISQSAASSPRSHVARYSRPAVAR